MFNLRVRPDRVTAILHQATGWFWIQLPKETATNVDAKARAIFTPQDPKKRGRLLIICEPQGSEQDGWTVSTNGNQTAEATGVSLFDLLRQPQTMAALELDPASC